MRTKVTASIVTIALLGVVAFSVIGQEEPLPVVIPKVNPALAAIPLAEPTIMLAAEPIREYRPPTLIDAARHNDYITFDALYTAAKKRGENVSQFDALHELWTYSVTDPIGAFYGTELYLQLSRAYPGYSAYIDEFRVIDSRGNEFYPTSETRAFLLDRALEGRPGPRVLVADAKPVPPARVAAEPRPVRSGSVERRPLPAAKPVPVASTRGIIAPPQPQPSAIAETTAPAATTPEARTADPFVVPVGEPVVITPKSAAAPVPVSAPPDLAPVAEPVVITPESVAAPGPVTAPLEPSRPASRGILLMIIGLIGVGLLALILRTPREEPVTVIPQGPVKASMGNVEPLRKPEARATDETRATGSHG